jgi:hypothetical protein
VPFGAEVLVTDLRIHQLPITIIPGTLPGKSDVEVCVQLEIE